MGRAQVKHADGLNERERKFVESFMADGNATKAALSAGYAKTSAAVTGSRLIRKANIKAAIDKRANTDPKIATRAQRQQFWSEVMLGQNGYKGTEMHNRLKASDLLGKSQADFVPRDDETGQPLTLEIRLTDATASSDPE